MQVCSLLVGWSILLVGFLHPSAAVLPQDGNQLLRACALAMHLIDSPQAEIQALEKPQQALEAGYCLGLLRGLANMNMVWQDHTKDTSMFFCLPTESTTGQWMRVVVKYLQEHPERLHEDDITLARLAFTSAFPCQPRTLSPRR
jgi:Ssp1 endopeptidase immunity protein Rap1a